MAIRKFFENLAVQFDPNERGGWSNPDVLHDFVCLALEECDDCIPDDFYVRDFNEDARTIAVALDRHNGVADQPYYFFQLVADPLDEDDDQWIVFDLYHYQPNKEYNFKIS